MLRIFSTLVFCGIISPVFSQCVSDFDFGNVGFGVSPDPQLGENFVSGVVNQPYYDVLHILIPEFASDIDEVYPPTLLIDSIQLENVVFTDTVTLIEYAPEQLGLQIICNNNGDSGNPCSFLGATQYCASIEGTPNQPGVFRIDLNVLGWLTIFEPFSAPAVFANFILNIQCDVIESVVITDYDSELGTLGNIDVTLGLGVVASSATWYGENGTVVGTELDLIDVGPGVYDLTLVADGCTSYFEGYVVSDAAINCALAADVVVIDEVIDVSLGSVDVSITGGNGLLTFSWTDVNGLVFSSAEDLMNMSSGTYTLLITDELGCELQIFNIYVDAVTSIEELDVNPSWNIIPNPVTSSFSLQGILHNYDLIKILDMQGRVIHSETFISNQTWNTSDWKSGVYFIQLSGDLGSETRRLVVKH